MAQFFYWGIAGEEQDMEDLFSNSSLQRLLACCPSPASERSVWRIAEALPCLAAAKQLLVSRMQLLAAGELLPDGLDAVSAAAAASSAVAADGSDEAAAAAAAADAAAVLACLAAGSTGPKVAAMLCVALGLDWPGCTSTHEPVATAAKPPTAGGQTEAMDDIWCHSCGLSEPEDTMLLCDGCDAAYHTSCLQPALSSVPEGDWFCSGCCRDIRACRLPRSAAAGYISLLLLSDSGRQLLTKQDTLQRALPLLQQEAAAAVVEAHAAVVGAAGAGAGAAADEDVTTELVVVVKALRLSTLHTRAAMHVLAQSVEEQPVALADGGSRYICLAGGVLVTGTVLLHSSMHQVGGIC